MKLTASEDDLTVRIPRALKTGRILKVSEATKPMEGFIIKNQ